MAKYIKKYMGRRAFINNATKATGALLAGAPLLSRGNNNNKQPLTVGAVMDLFINEVPNAPFENTVDTLKAGNRDIVVTGIVTCMFATIEVINKAITAGANFIIAHEPTFYNHADETAWLQHDEVYQYKANLLKQHNIAVWRNHDYIHRHIPDGVKTAVVSQLKWTDYFNAENNIANIPATTLKALIAHAKSAMGVPMLRYIGNLNQSCKRVLIMPGAAGGKRQIEALIQTKPDVIFVGEIQEWETAEYIRDARSKGLQVSLVVLGHIASEAPGSDYMVHWLHEKIPSVKAMHISSQNSLQFL